MATDLAREADVSARRPLSDITRTIVRNASALTIAQVFYRIVTLFLSILLARYLGVIEQGRYALVLNFIAIFQAFSDLGIANLVIRDINQERGDPSSLIGTYFRLLLLVNGLLLILAMGVALLLKYDGELFAGIALAGLGMALGGASSAYYAALAARERMKRIARIEILVTLLLAFGSLAVMLSGGRLVWLCAVAALGGAGRLVLLGLAARVPTVHAGNTGKELRALLVAGLPFALHAGMYIVLTRIDVLILERHGSALSLGAYTAATRLTLPLTVFSMMTATALFPVISRAIRTEPSLAWRMVRQAQMGLAGLGLLIAGVTTVWAEPIVVLLFGAEFRDSAPLLRILIWYIPIFSSYQVVSDLLVAAHRLGTVVTIGALCLAINIGANLLLVPDHGALAASWIRIGTELLRCVAFLVLLRFVLHPSSSPGRT